MIEDILFSVLIILLVLLLFVLAFVLLRTLTFARRMPPVEPLEVVEVDGAVVAEHLAAAVRCATISHGDGAVDRKAFLDLHRMILNTYPRIHSTLHHQAVNKYSLLYIWPGQDLDLPPVLLAGHLDVVPADEATLSDWQYPPFSGQIADGYVWGRGTLDIKNQTIAILEAVEGLLRSGYKPHRSIILAFGHDEEVGGMNGAFKIAELLGKQSARLGVVLDEGGAVMPGKLVGVHNPVALLATGEKGFLTLKLTVESTPGHSSMPPQHTAIGILARAITRLENRPFPPRMYAVRTMFKALGADMPFSTQVVLANNWLFGGVLRRRMLRKPVMAALVRTTSAVTMVSGGVKDNILPARAQATVNFRLMPGDNIAGVCEHVRKAIADPQVQFAPVEGAAWEASPVSPTDTPSFVTLSNTIRGIFGDIPVAPYMVLGATDARHYTQICDAVYRFTPAFFEDGDLERVHGVNERISVDSLARMVQFYSALIKAWDDAESPSPAKT
ncbi:MAG TPA: M20 family peptidase [Levilinea sp.]|nr:M20 family peptidase [Levilinea sp.]